MKKSIPYSIMISVCFFFVLSCVSIPSVSRVPSNSLTDLSGYWNNTDVRTVCDSLIASCFNSQKMAQFSKDNGRLPRILVGNFKNDSDEHIDTGIIANTMRAAITNNGKADFVASGSARDEIRTEKEDQLGNVSDDTAASIGRETGADFILNGTVKTIVERAGNMSTRSYFVTSEITHIESGLVYWMDQNDEIKKIIQTPRVKF